MENAITKKFESREQIMESLQEKRDLADTDMSGLDLSDIKLMGLRVGVNITPTHGARA